MMGTSQPFFEGTYQLWQTVVMDTSAQRKNETDHPGGT
jgi:hypothetical protein